MLVIKKFMILMHFGLAFGACRKYSYSVKEVGVCYQLYNDVIRDVYGIRSLIACSTLCTKDNCCSVLFDEMSERCITYSAFATSTLTGCGWKYAETDLDICTRPCDHGYSYDASNNTCRTDCVSYGSTYGRFDEYVLSNLDNRMINGSSEQACKDACTAETTFECRTAELSYNGWCYLSVETALTAPSYYYAHSSYTHFQRNCA